MSVFSYLKQNMIKNILKKPGDVQIISLWDFS